MIKATLIDHMGDDSSVVDAARVSFAKHSGHKTIEEAVKAESWMRVNKLKSKVIDRERSDND
jgi:hypothetical protein